MRVGVGLPAAIPGATGADVIAWATAAEGGPFASLCCVDRVAYDCYEPLIALAAAAAVTRRVELVTTVLISPLRNTTMLAKQLASIDRLSEGRLVVGLGLGARQEDYEVTGVDHSSRGATLAEQLVSLPEVYESERVGLRTRELHGPRLLVGGATPPAFARMARYASGYIHGGGPPRIFARAAEQARAAWLDAGRPGAPELWGQAYFAFGEAQHAGRDYMRDYYGFTGAFAEKLAAGMLSTPRQAAEFIRAYAEAGCDHLVILPAVTQLEQLSQLADVVARAR
ncbi:MAG: LLM class flavin-dependent oxidoreductase [Solirubrobacteraceae bacterium]